MKNLIHVRNSLIIILCVTVISMAVGFIVLSIELKKEKEKSSNFDVMFVNIEKSTSVKGGEKDPTSHAEIVKAGKELDMNFSLTSPRDEITYTVTIENNSTLPAEIIDIIESPDYKDETFKKIIEPVSITISDIKGKIIPPNETMDFKITVYYVPSSNPPSTKNFSYKLALLTKSR